LLKKINEHKKIRPFLREYPFNESRAKVSISFQTNKAAYYLDGSVASVFCARNKIFYRTAKKQLVKYGPVYDATTGGIFSPAYEREEEILIPLIEEPYEEAVKIVAGSSTL
jgi:hypothetical protein